MQLLNMQYQRYTDPDLKIFVYVCVHIKTIHCKFRIRNPKNHRKECVKLANFLKIRLIFNIFYCF